MLSFRLPRLSGWLIITLVLAAGVMAIAPQQLPVSLYKLSLVTLAGVVGYWLDRSIFPYARPDAFLASLAEEDPWDEESQNPEVVAVVHGVVRFDDAPLLRLAGVCMLRRACIVAATMLAMGLGA